ncbi:hypothetical protein PIROE2DRAFT_61254 [Piromyces sp. E2]|nr:hypothetical protein PIROE2DRAFT_61254 [Piromyces sp. E2]|eukprot:OUM63477.1 hypothetical protein PIROE2DRAFT_61254 [Piromyces sp. E2]
MKRISIISTLLLSLNVHSIIGKHTRVTQHLENINNEENSIIIEWANDKSGRCQAYSIYEDEVLLKSNIPIHNSKISIDDLQHKHGKLTLKCDSFVKQKREVKGDGVEEPSSVENSVEESDTDDDSIINAIDNFFYPSDDDDEDKESSNIVEKVFKLNDSKDNDSETKSDANIDNKDSSKNKNNKDNKNDEGNSDNHKSDKNGNSKDSSDADKKQDNDQDVKNDKNNNSDANKNVNEITKGDKNKQEEKDKNDKSPKEIEEEKDSKKDKSPVHLGVGVSLSFLLTGGLFLSVMKIRKMSDLQLEINAQEMSANSMYVPSPRISNSGSMSLSMSSLELGNTSTILQENSFGSTLNSFIV